MTNEILKKAKECKSAEELLALAEANGIELTAEEAEARFNAFNNDGELSDAELSSVNGGGCGGDGDSKQESKPSPDRVVEVKGYQVGKKCFNCQYDCWQTKPGVGSDYELECAVCDTLGWGRIIIPDSRDFIKQPVNIFIKL